MRETRGEKTGARNFGNSDERSMLVMMVTRRVQLQRHSAGESCEDELQEHENEKKLRVHDIDYSGKLNRTPPFGDLNIIEE